MSDGRNRRRDALNLLASRAAPTRAIAPQAALDLDRAGATPAGPREPTSAPDVASRLADGSDIVYL